MLPSHNSGLYTLGLTNCFEGPGGVKQVREAGWTNADKFPSKTDLMAANYDEKYVLKQTYSLCLFDIVEPMLPLGPFRRAHTEGRWGTCACVSRACERARKSGAIGSYSSPLPPTYTHERTHAHTTHKISTPRRRGEGRGGILGSCSTRGFSTRPHPCRFVFYALCTIPHRPSPWSVFPTVVLTLRFFSLFDRRRNHRGFGAFQFALLPCWMGEIAVSKGLSGSVILINRARVHKLHEVQTHAHDMGVQTINTSFACKFSALAIRSASHLVHAPFW